MSKTAKRIKKAKRIYQDEGFEGLSDKTLRFTSKKLGRIRRKLSFKRETYDERRLRDEAIFLENEIFEVTGKDIAASQKACAGPVPKDIKTANWFIPYFNHFGYNGIQTIFRLVQKLSQEGVHNRIIIYDNPVFDVKSLESQMNQHFPGIQNYEIVVFGEDKQKALKKLPPSDLAFATFWSSAYFLLKFNKTKRKYYFIQDYEPSFYEAGSTSALAESTYRFGLRGIVNTPGLLAAINQRHGLEGISFIPTVNKELYYPNPDKKNKKVRIFLYARPFNPRNAFNLGVLTLKQLLEKYGNKIEIVTAGADWDEEEYGLKGKITNLGLLTSLQDVADLYRSCDIGFSYMLTPHTSYQMLEYTASGMATVMNRNEDHGWLHKDGVNCLLAEPSPAAMAEKISMLIDDPKLRAKLLKEAKKELGYTWDQQMERLWNDIKSR